MATATRAQAIFCGSITEAALVAAARGDRWGVSCFGGSFVGTAGALKTLGAKVEPQGFIPAGAHVSWRCGLSGSLHEGITEGIAPGESLSAADPFVAVHRRGVGRVYIQASSLKAVRDGRSWS